MWRGSAASTERADDPLHPPGALREALANAFCHFMTFSVGGHANLSEGGRSPLMPGVLLPWRSARAVARSQEHGQAHQPLHAFPVRRQVQDLELIDDPATAQEGLVGVDPVDRLA